MDKSDLLPWYSHYCQFLPNIVINIENACFRHGKVAENELGGFLLHGIFPYFKSIFHAAVYLAPFRVRQHVI